MGNMQVNIIKGYVRDKVKVREVWEEKIYQRCKLDWVEYLKSRVKEASCTTFSLNSIID